MSSLNDIIGRERMIGVTVDMNKFIKILKTLNERQKDQEQRIAAMESQISSFATKEYANENFTKLEETHLNIINDFDKKMNETSNNISNKIMKLTDQLEGKINDMLIAQMTTGKNFHDSIETKINMLTETMIMNKDESDKIVQEMKENISHDFDEVNARVKTLYSTVMKSLTNKNDQKEIEKLKEHIASIPLTLKNDNLKALSDEEKDQMKNEIKNFIMDEVENKMKNFQEVFAPTTLHDSSNSEIDLSSIKISPSQIIELISYTNYNKNELLKLKNNIDDINKEIDELSVIQSSRKLNKNSSQVKSNLIDPMFEANQTMEKVNILIQQMKESVDESNQKSEEINSKFTKRDIQYRKIINALIDGQRLIHHFADGLENIPIQNMKIVDPDYFNEDPEFDRNTSLYTVRFPPKTRRAITVRSKDQEIKDDQTNNNLKSLDIDHIDQPNNPFADYDNLDVPSFSEKRVSGLLHLVSSVHQRDIRMIGKEHAVMVRNPDKTNKITTQAESLAVPLSYEENNYTSEQNNQYNDSPNDKRKVTFVKNDQNDVSEITNDTLRELTFLLGQFKQEKDQLMTTIERKIDRDTVERLFNKFRVLINNLNEKEKSLEEISKNFVTTKQYEALVKSISVVQPPNSKKKSNKCMFCGKTMSMINDVICGNEDYDEDHIYTEGGCYKKSKDLSLKIKLHPQTSGQIPIDNPP
ncbi:hypothetical protein TRFO_12724 [Tritrichomonas foetus]|uniref:Uncharacterized protein n=1 Tax=Tritrichomonas foetus TaxID=1144522 RepID=A0A1J4L0R1_9EUKA|nr:hypothetical protein TRFO_12724 [Tritrichomonas foetus]|eukprot:OHT17027.1 hypothetical protein TRFO_12724 [Tritrichomonas foetus]